MIKIEHDVNKRFYVKQDQEEAELLYAMEGKCLNIMRVYVPSAFRGQGLAASLTREAFEYAKSQNYQVIPTCPYVSQTFLERNPQYQEILKK